MSIKAVAEGSAPADQQEQMLEVTSRAQEGQHRIQLESASWLTNTESEGDVLGTADVIVVVRRGWWWDKWWADRFASAAGDREGRISLRGGGHGLG